MKECNEAAGPSAKIAIRPRPNPRGSLISTATPASVFLPLARPPANPGSTPRCSSRPPQQCRSTDPAPGAPEPSAADAASPTRSRTTRSPATAAGSTPTCRPCPRRTTSRPRTTASTASVGDRTASPPSPTSVRRSPGTCTAHRPPTSRRHGHSEDTRSPRASAASPDSRGSPRRSRTRTGTPRRSSDMHTGPGPHLIHSPSGQSGQLNSPVPTYCRGRIRNWA